MFFQCIEKEMSACDIGRRQIGFAKSVCMGWTGKPICAFPYYLSKTLIKSRLPAFSSASRTSA